MIWILNRYVPCFLREVPDLYLEPGGGISVKLHTKTGSVTPDMPGLDPGDEPPSILVMEDGKIKEEELQSVKKSKEWLMKELQKKIYKTSETNLYPNISFKKSLVLY
ncbi:hypothetical protein CVN76_18450 [Bacillus sp. mrc49]|nr:hypothetical protein CVN76_18450 [Bacillus sp. mrc49]